MVTFLRYTFTFAHDLKRLLAISLIIALSFQFFSKIGIIGSFIINQDYIAKALCINRDKPAMHCDGKCHLKKQLEEQSQEEQKLPSTLKEIIETVLFFDAPLIISPACIVQEDQANTPYTFALSAELACSIFHPPQTNA